MVDYEKHFRMYCEENSLPINLSFDMPEGYETANGTFDPTVNTLFINKDMLQSQPEYEQVKARLGYSPELQELHAFWTPKKPIANQAYEELYRQIDEITGETSRETSR